MIWLWQNERLHIRRQMHTGHLIQKKSVFLISLFLTGQIGRKQNAVVYAAPHCSVVSEAQERRHFNGCLQVSPFLLTLIPVRLRLLIPAISLPNSHCEDSGSMQNTMRSNITKSQHWVLRGNINDILVSCGYVQLVNFVLKSWRFREKISFYRLTVKESN